LGLKLASDLQKHTSAVSDSTVNDYIERLGRRLTAQAPAGDVNWEFKVIRDDVGGSTHEAISIPGGHIFVSTSLILGVEGEAELAGMLAHSIAHIAERHGMRMAGRGRDSRIPIVFIGSWVLPDGAPNDDRAFVPAGYLKMQRTNELGADRTAVRIMAASGYDPSALLDHIRRTQRDVTPEYSALPPRFDRISALESLVTNRSSHTGRDGELKAIQDRARRLVLLSKRDSAVPLKQPPSLRKQNEQ
jgi:predicted Zn-dependent protease